VVIPQLSANPYVQGTYHKFGIFLAVPYAFLIGVGVSRVYHLLEKKNIISKTLPNRDVHRNILSKALTSLTCLMLITASAYPFLTGDVIYPGGNVTPSARVEIPSYYYEAADWLKAQNRDFTIYSLPMPTNYGIAYQWRMDIGERTDSLDITSTSNSLRNRPSRLRGQDYS